jgi:hypothetical protein
MKKEGSSSFLKKRTKKPLRIGIQAGHAGEPTKVFWFFFLKKNDFL